MKTTKIAVILADARALGRAAIRDLVPFKDLAAKAGVPLTRAVAAIPLAVDLKLLAFSLGRGRTSQARSQAKARRGRKDVPTVGEVVRAVRKSLGITQVQLQDRADVHQITVSSIETGHLDPSVRIIRKLAAGLGVLAGDLI